MKIIFHKEELKHNLFAFLICIFWTNAQSVAQDSTAAGAIITPYPTLVNLYV